MARVATLAAEVTADIGPLKAQMAQAGRSVEDFTRRARTNSKQFDGAMQASTQVNRRFQSQVQNAAFQVGDFAVQVGGGTSAMRAMSMQLPQLLGGFGVMGAVIGAAVAILGPFVEYLLRGEEAANGFAEELSSLKPSLDGIRGQVRELGGLQEKYVAAIQATGAASGPTANAVVSATKREYDAKLSLLDVSQKLLRLEMQERRIALRNFESQAENARNEALRNAQNLGAGTRQATDAAGFAYTGPRTVGEALANSGMDTEQAEQRRMAIQKIQAELELMGLAAEEASAAINGVFQMGDETSGGGGGASRVGSGKSPVVQEVQAISAELQLLTQMTKGELGEQVGAWGKYFSNLQSLSGSNSKKLTATAKALGAVEATINAYRAATQALADPTVPFWGKAAAYASVLAAGLGAVNAIKGAGSGGGTGGVAAAAAAPPANINSSPRVALQLIGSENATFSAGQIRGLINAINEATESGSLVRLV